MQLDRERRRHQRITLMRALEVRVDGRGASTKARACDVSIGGLAFTTEAELRIGDQIRVGMAGPLGSEPVLDAVVRYVRRDAGRYVIGAERRSP